ncbi:MAG: hypothetical protein QXS54_11650 [Candidatus Methanomethylicaceae archaeon]
MVGTVAYWVPTMVALIILGILVGLVKKVYDLVQFYYFSRVISETYASVTSSLPFAYFELANHEDFKMMNDSEMIDWVVDAVRTAAQSAGMLIDVDVARQIVKANHNTMMRMVNGGFEELFSKSSE